MLLLLMMTIDDGNRRDLKAYITYICPMLEYNSPLWSPSLKKDHFA